MRFFCSLALLLVLGSELIAARHHQHFHHRPKHGRHRGRRLSARREQLMMDIEASSDNHKKEGQDFGEVRELLHKFFQLANQKAGLPQADFNTEVVSDALPQFDDGTELSKNRAVSSDLFENDMVLTVNQITDIISHFGGGKRRRRKRKVIVGSTFRWGGGTVPYKFGDTDSTWQNQIRAGLNHWETETCIRFKENGNGADYMQFIKGSGCYSSVGRIGGAQQVSIGTGCESLGIVSHEIGHTLGFWHEQSRPDRDTYITVKSENMVAGTAGNVAKRAASEVNYYGTPYDVGSVMHYGPKAFTTSASLLTLETKDTKYRNTIGQRAHLSFVDVKQVNKAYCASRCPNKLGCRNGGYENPNDCSRCKCPEGLGGKCDRVQSSSCGGELTATNQWQTLSNSGGGPCYWRIASDGGKVRFQVTAANYACSDTCVSYVEVKHNSNFQQTGFRLCCGAAGGEVLSAREDIIVISMNSGSFSLRYISEGGRSPAPAPAPAPAPRPNPAPSPPRAGGTTTQQCTGRMRAPCGAIQNLRSQMSDESGGGTIDLPESMAPFVRFDDRLRVKRQPPPWVQFRGGPPPWGRRPPWARGWHRRHHWRDDRNRGGDDFCLQRLSFNCEDRGSNGPLRVRFLDEPSKTRRK
uniref:Metalloendopeptidase n=1 Tax=Plectus sambesii TaxID=2011161 RepID=A0A914WG51_9BILA